MLSCTCPAPRERFGLTTISGNCRRHQAELVHRDHENKLAEWKKEQAGLTALKRQTLEARLALSTDPDPKSRMREKTKLAHRIAVIDSLAKVQLDKLKRTKQDLQARLRQVARTTMDTADMDLIGQLLEYDEGNETHFWPMWFTGEHHDAKLWTWNPPAHCPKCVVEK